MGTGPTRSETFNCEESDAGCAAYRVSFYWAESIALSGAG